MKKFAFIILICLMLALVGCGDGKISDGSDVSREKITVNLPEDDSVNGYRAKSPTEDNNLAAEAKYCGNLTSKILHKSSCTFAKKLKPENKSEFMDLNTALNEGYTPCKRCNP